MSAYDTKIEAERRLYENCETVHDLPPIFHYWSNRYLQPRLETFGFSTPDQMFEQVLLESCRLSDSGIRQFASIGSGNCDLEVRLAQALRRNGCDRFVIDCLEINERMLERGRVAASDAGVAENFNLVQTDLNTWSPSVLYDAALANQSLHHIVNLEHLFKSIKESLKPGGQFAICDTIGRNGNQCWPEALEVVQECWRRLPPSYRFNRQLHRYQEMYENWDCSEEGFEGIRSQDILPLLVEAFQFRLFVGYSHVMEPFLGRSFGYNFDPGQPWDREFVDRLHQIDQEGAASGRLKPTQMIAVVGTERAGPVVLNSGQSPQDSIRWPDGAEFVKSSAQPAYAWKTWPHDATRELELACQMLSEGEARAAQLRQEVLDRTAWAQRFEREFNDRTEWALKLKEELEECTGQVRRLQKELTEQYGELEERTAWAQHLDAEKKALEALVEERTTWALALAAQLEERTAWALTLQKQVEELTRHPIRRFLRRVKPKPAPPASD